MGFKRIAAGIVAAGITISGVSAVSADAFSKPTVADKRAMVSANRVCASIPGETEFENCVIGAFILKRERYIDSRFYNVDYGRDADHQIVLTRHSVKV